MKTYKLADYGPFSLYYDERENQFTTAETDDQSARGLEAPSLRELRSKIDAFLTHEKKRIFPIPALFQNYSGWHKVVITSFDGFDAWIKLENGQRQKCNHKKYLRVFNDESLAILKKAEEAEDRMQAARKERDAALDELKPVKFDIVPDQQ